MSSMEPKIVILSDNELRLAEVCLAMCVDILKELPADKHPGMGPIRVIEAIEAKLCAARAVES